MTTIPCCGLCQSLDCLDVLVKIFFHLDPADIVCCALTCRLWHRAASDVALWRHLCLRRWPSLSADLQASAHIRSFAAFFSQRASQHAAADPTATAAALGWLRDQHRQQSTSGGSSSVTFFVDVSLHDRPFFSCVVGGATVVKERLRFKLPKLPNDTRDGNCDERWRDVTAPFTDMHVQLSIVRHSDGQCACLVNGFPTKRAGTDLASSRSANELSSQGLKCVLMLIDNSAFLNFFW